jgi:hypothetical protein
MAAALVPDALWSLADYFGLARHGLGIRKGSETSVVDTLHKRP